MDMSVNKLWEILKDGEAWRAAVPGVLSDWTTILYKAVWHVLSYLILAICRAEILKVCFPNSINISWEQCRISSPTPDLLNLNLYFKILGCFICTLKFEMDCSSLLGLFSLGLIGTICFRYTLVVIFLGLRKARSLLDWRLPAFTGELILGNSLSFPKPQFSSL